MNITLLTDWAAISPFYEYSFALAEELARLGHQISILAPPANSATPQIANHQDGERVLRLTPEVGLVDIAAQLAAWETDVLMVHGECEPDHSKLSQLVHSFTQGTKRSFLIIHSDDYSKTLNHAVFTAVLLPNSQWTNRQPPGRVRLGYFEQGIPVFELPTDLQAYRRATDLPVYTAAEPDETEGYLLVTFDGKTSVRDCLTAINYVNRFGLTGKSVYLFVQCARMERFAYYDELRKTEPFLIASVGRLEASELAPIVAAADGVLLVYPDTVHKQTSSALRFALGCQVPIITNKGNHTQGLQEVITSWAPSSSPEGIKHAIVSHFTNLPFRLLTGKRHAEFIAPKLSWPVVVKRLHDDILVRNSALQQNGNTAKHGRKAAQEEAVRPDGAAGSTAAGSTAAGEPTTGGEPSGAARSPRAQTTRGPAAAPARPDAPPDGGDSPDDGARGRRPGRRVAARPGCVPGGMAPPRGWGIRNLTFLAGAHAAATSKNKTVRTSMQPNLKQKIMLLVALVSAALATRKETAATIAADEVKLADLTSQIAARDAQLAQLHADLDLSDEQKAQIDELLGAAHAAEASPTAPPPEVVTVVADDDGDKTATILGTTAGVAPSIVSAPPVAAAEAAPGEGENSAEGAAAAAGTIAG